MRAWAEWPRISRKNRCVRALLSIHVKPATHRPLKTRLMSTRVYEWQKSRGRTRVTWSDVGRTEVSWIRRQLDWNLLSYSCRPVAAYRHGLASRRADAAVPRACLFTVTSATQLSRFATTRLDWSMLRKCRRFSGGARRRADYTTL